MTEILSSALPYIQAILSVLLIIAIILQQTGTGIGGALGGGADNDSVHYTRRGTEKMLFQATFVLAFLFVLSALIALII